MTQFGESSLPDDPQGRAAPPETEPMQARLDEAKAAAVAGRLGEAVAIYNSILRERPTAKAFKGLADALAASGMFADAAQFYRRALRLDPNLAEAHNNLANVLWRQSRDPEAIAEYRRAIACRPDFVEAKVNLALVQIERGEAEEAIALLEAVVNEQPESKASWRTLATAYRQVGRADEALAAVRHLLALDDRDAQSLVTASSIHRSLGDPQEALRLAQQSVRLSPTSVEAYIAAAQAHSALGQSDQALTLARQAVEIAPTNARCYGELGALLLAAGIHEEAEQCLQHALKLDANYTKALFHMGNLHELLGRHGEAVKAYEQVLARQPKFTPAAMNLGCSLLKVGRPQDAERVLSRVLEVDPRNGVAWSNLSIALDDLGRYDEAVAAARKGVELAPRAEAHVNLGVALQVRGELDAAAAAFRDAVEINPDLVPALYSLVASGQRSDPDLIPVIERVLEKKRLTDDNRAQLYFALAKLHDAVGQHEAAFEAARQGHLIDIKRAPYDPLLQDRFVANMKSVFTQPFFAERSSFGSGSPKPIFIVGLPRTGTTLVEQVLASHSQVAGAGELLEIPRLIRSLPQFVRTTHKYPQAAIDLDEPSTLRLASSYLRALRNLAGASPRVTDKLPSNAFHLGFLALLFPQAKFIYCVRNPYDTFISTYLMRFRKPLSYAQDMRSFAHYYKSCRDIMAYWQEVLPVKILTVRYEDFVRDQLSGTRALLDHCGLAWEEGCLRFHETVRPVRTGSSAQVRKPLYESSIGRYHPYARQLEELRSLLGEDDGAGGGH